MSTVGGNSQASALTFELDSLASHGPANSAAALDAPGIGRWRGGRAAVADAGAPSPADVPFRVASITKPFVAVTLHRLASRHALDLQMPVRSLLSDVVVELLVRGGYDPDRISCEHLLSHTSGLVDHSTLAFYEHAVMAEPQRRWSRHEQIALAMQTAPCAAPGEFYAYSDTGYVMLGEIVERLTGRHLGDAVRRELQFDALGLPNTWWEAVEAPPPGTPPLARQYQGDTDVTDFHASFDLYGGGGLVSTVDDLARFARRLLDGTLLGPRELLSALRTPAARRDPTLEPWRTHGYLVATYRVGDRWVLGHTGAWGSAMLYCPNLDLAVAARAQLFDLITRLIKTATRT
jgi:D-alanyl-D-alanine carboxypeptidase